MYLSVKIDCIEFQEASIYGSEQASIAQYQEESNDTNMLLDNTNNNNIMNRKNSVEVNGQLYEPSGCILRN